MVELMMTLVIGLIIISLLYWIAAQLPLPDPFGRILPIVIVALGLIWLIYILMGAMPGGTLRLR